MSTGQRMPKQTFSAVRVKAFHFRHNSYGYYLNTLYQHIRIYTTYIAKKLSFLETGFHILSPDELEQSMPKSRVEAEQFGIDVVVDCTGVPKALENIIPYLARGAKVLIFGCAPTGQSMK